MNKNLQELLEFIKDECIKERINILTVYKVLHIIKTFFKKQKINILYIIITYKIKNYT